MSFENGNNTFNNNIINIDSIINNGGIGGNDNNRKLESNNEAYKLDEDRIDKKNQLMMCLL